MADPYQVVREFESALCEYTGAPYCVTTTSCTMALLLACKWEFLSWSDTPIVNIPKRTYVSVPMSIIHAGGHPIFEDRQWLGNYQLRPYSIADCARWLTGDMYLAGQMMCLSFHPSKHLGISTHGGAILHDDPKADEWLRLARFDGRMEGVHPLDDNFKMIGWHCYMAPATAAEGLQRLEVLPKRTDPLPCDSYPDLSKMEIFL